MQLHALLQKIIDNKPLNFDQVIKQLPADVDWNRVFSVVQSGKNKHTVEVVDQIIFDMLLAQSLQPETRADAASSSIFSSHDVKCESAYMLCFPATKNDTKNERERILTAVATSKKILLPLSFSPAKQAILIENQDCFFQFKALLAHYQNLINLPQSDIFFSGGSRILNQDLHPVLSQYTHIKCVFDYDLAGLQITKQLINRGYQDVEYLVPTNLIEYTSLFTFSPQSAGTLSAMLSMCKQQKLFDLADIINKRKRFMEQEAMLTIRAHK